MGSVGINFCIISPVCIVLSCPERVLSALFDRSATVTAIHSLNSITARSTAAIRKVANNLDTTGMDSLTSVGPQRCNYHRLNDGSPPAKSCWTKTLSTPAAHRVTRNSSKKTLSEIFQKNSLRTPSTSTGLSHWSELR